MDTGKLITTLLLLVAAGVAVAMAPRLTPAPPQVEEVAASDVCVSLGRFECCVKDDEPDKRR